MSTGINGVVEIFQNGKWVEYDSIETPPYYDLFGCLFGVRNYAGFRPLFAFRGIPKDASEYTQLEMEEAEDHSWVNFAELTTIDWEEPAVDFDERVHCFKLQPDGSEVYDFKCSYMTGLDEIRAELQEKHVARLDENTICRIVRLKRADALGTPNYRAIFEQLKGFSEQFGALQVRLVVGFWY